MQRTNNHADDDGLNDDDDEYEFTPKLILFHSIYISSFLENPVHIRSTFGQLG